MTNHDRLKPLLEKFELLKKEVDSLQIITAEKKKPRYKETSTIVSILALLFSFGTTLVSYNKANEQETNTNRAELIKILQRVASLPKEILEMNIKYRRDKETASIITGYYAQENSLLLRQARDLINRLPESKITATEYYCMAYALSTDNPADAIEYAQKALKTNDNKTVIVASKDLLAGLQFATGKCDEGRNTYKEVLELPKKLNWPEFGIAASNIDAYLNWAIAEANLNNTEMVRSTFAEAENLAGSLPPGPGTDIIRDKIKKTRLRLGYFLPPPQELFEIMNE